MKISEMSNIAAVFKFFNFFPLRNFESKTFRPIKARCSICHGMCRFCTRLRREKEACVTEISLIIIDNNLLSPNSGLLMNNIQNVTHTDIQECPNGETKYTDQDEPSAFSYALFCATQLSMYSFSRFFDVRPE